MHQEQYVDDQLSVASDFQARKIVSFSLDISEWSKKAISNVR